MVRNRINEFCNRNFIGYYAHHHHHRYFVHPPLALLTNGLTHTSCYERFLWILLLISVSLLSLQLKKC